MRGKALEFVLWLRWQTRGVSHLLAAVVLIAVADSVNPSTVAPALYLAAGKTGVRSLFGFIAGVLVVYVVGGLVLLLGPGQVLLGLLPRPGDEVRVLLELCVGIALFGLAAVLWLGRSRVARQVTKNQGRVDRSSFVVGMGIVIVELPTAFPYFAAIALMIGSGKDIPIQVGLLLTFNLVFIAPLLAIVIVRSLTGENGREWLERLRAGLDARLGVLLPSFVLAAAVALAALGTVGMIKD
jgi:cytochrome c biogenesis protein CcdA